MIEVSNLGKNYGSFEAVKGVSFEVGTGEIVGLLGPNGAGKTTIMKMLTCYHYPSFGDASIKGFDIYNDGLKVREVVGYLPETAPLYTDLSVMEYLNFIADARKLDPLGRKERISQVIEECGLTKMVYKTIDNLSKGYRQRVGLAQSIIHDPDLLILDEPSSGLDPNQIIEIRDLIRRIGEKKTVILSTHILQEVEAVCDRVLIMNEGKIAARGTTEEIRREMKGEVIFDMIVKGENLAAKQPSLEKLAIVKKLTSFHQIDDVKAEIKVSVDTEDSGEVLFDWAVGEGMKILSMTPQKISLEDIFRKLTTEGGV